MGASAGARLLLMTTCVLLIACDLTGPTDEPTLDCGTDLVPGFSAVEITGYVDNSFEGVAIFETATTGEPSFFLRLSDADISGESYRSILFERHRHSTPDIGMYVLANLEKPENRDTDRCAGT